MTQKQISEISKKDTIQKGYDRWSDEVQNNIKDVEKIFRQDPRKDTMQLKRQRKKLRTQYQNKENLDEKTVILERIKFIKQHIADKIIENGSRRIIKVAQQKKKFKADNGKKIWEIKQKFQKNQTFHAIKDEKTTESNVYPRF